MNKDSNKNSKKISWFSNFNIGKEKESFIADLSMMLQAGIPINDALSALKTQVKSAHLEKAVSQLEENVNNGMQVWQAFLNSKLLPAYAIALIRVGEESGQLNENLRLISTQEQKDNLLKERLHSSMIYPVLVLSLTAIIGVLLAWFILPRLAGVFTNLKLKLPLPTKVLLYIAAFLQDSGFWAVPVFIIACASVIYVFFLHPKTKVLGQTVLFNTPGIKTLIMETEISRFSYMLATMLKSGIPVVEAVKLVAESTNFFAYKKIYLKLQALIEEGDTFQKAFFSLPNSKRYLPHHIQQMLISAEKSGKLEDTLFVIAKNTEEKSEISTKNLSTILEPLLLVIVWLGVAMVALAIILPIYNVIGGLNNH